MATDDIVCVLRAPCRRPGLGALLRAHSRWEPDAWWKAGTPDRFGRVHDRNGFNLFVAGGRGWRSVAVATRRRIRALTALVEQGKKIGAEFQLDVGVMPGGRRWTLSVEFSTDDLELLHHLGIQLSVTAYAFSRSGPDEAKREVGESRPTRRRPRRVGSRRARAS